MPGSLLDPWKYIISLSSYNNPKLEIKSVLQMRTQNLKETQTFSQAHSVITQATVYLTPTCRVYLLSPEPSHFMVLRIKMLKQILIIEIIV